MILRSTATVALLVASVVVLTGCFNAAPESTPTPTAVFSSEEEAFAAAEETYRAYVDAVNARRIDPQSRPDPQEFLVGAALEADIDATREFDELGIRIEGESRVETVEPKSADTQTGNVTLEACYDSRAARVVDESGVDVTIEDRDPLILLEIDFIPINTELLIDEISAVDGGSC